MNTNRESHGISQESGKSEEKDEESSFITPANARLDRWTKSHIPG